MEKELKDALRWSLIYAKAEEEDRNSLKIKKQITDDEILARQLMNFLQPLSGANILTTTRLTDEVNDSDILTLADNVTTTGAMREKDRNSVKKQITDDEILARELSLQPLLGSDVETTTRLTNEVNSDSDVDILLPETLPDEVTGAKLRSLSNTFKRSAELHGTVDGHKMKLRSDQAKCHRIPNELLVKAYNSTTDQEVKRMIVAFNYSKHNMWSSTHNKDHSRMERGLKSGDILATDLSQKTAQFDTAIMKAMSSDYEYSGAFLSHMLQTMAAESTEYTNWVANLDKRCFKTFPDVKETIECARDCQLINEEHDTVATRSESEWDRFRKEMKGSDLSRQQLSDLYWDSKDESSPPQTQTVVTPPADRKTSGATAVRESPKAAKEHSPASHTPRSPTAAVRSHTTPPGKPQTSWNAHQQAYAGQGHSKEQIRSFYTPVAASPPPSRRHTTSASATTPPTRAPNAWNAYQHEQAGMGYTRPQMQANYHRSSSSSSYSSGGPTYSSSGSANGRALHTGSRGGQYYMTDGGNKRYV